jgi:hypothetical protein
MDEREPVTSPPLRMASELPPKQEESIVVSMSKPAKKESVYR